MKPSLSLLPLTAALLLANEFVVSSFASSPPPIPLNQLGAVAGKQYQGDGLSVRATATGAELRCAFQRLEGEVTAKGLWLRSTADNSSGERFRVLATGVGRDRECAAGSCCGSADWQSAVSRIGNPQAAPGWSVQPTASRRHSRLPTCATAEGPVAMPAMGRVETSENVTRFIRPGLTEEYSVSVDGVRQDFLIAQPPVGTGELRLELDVTGATVAPLGNGVRLTVPGSGRQLAYHRLHVTDATGRELPAQMEVAAEMPDATKLAVLVDDANAVYPVRIDPTFSDEDWSSLGSGVNNVVQALAISGTNIYAGGRFTLAGGNAAYCVAKWNGSGWSSLGPGMNDWVLALAVSGTNLYAGGYFSMAGGVSANRVARWNGNNWSALGSGLGPMMGIYSVRALALSGTNLYAGGSFTTAGFQTVNNIARWNGTSWSAMGSGMNHTVEALAVSGTNLYAGGWFTTAGSMSANSIARWNGSRWSALGSGMGGSEVNIVYALAVSGSNLYAGGLFVSAGGKGVGSIARWNGISWASVGSGVGVNTNYYASVRSLAVSGDYLYAGGDFTRAGGIAANRIARWDGNSWSALGSGMNTNVLALAISGYDLYAGGNFTSAGNKNSSYVAKANIFVPQPGCFTSLNVSLATGFSCTFLDATIGQPYRIQTSPSLAGQWTDFTNFVYNGPVVISDPAPLAGTNKFFRAVTP
jgi:hypothetical protein